MRVRSVGKLVIGLFIAGAALNGCKNKILKNGHDRIMSETSVASNYNLNDKQFNQVAIKIHKGDITWQQADSFFRAETAAVAKDTLSENADTISKSAKYISKMMDKLKPLKLHR